MEIIHAKYVKYWETFLELVEKERKVISLMSLVTHYCQSLIILVSIVY